jgi:hypothetical protein
MGLAKLVHVTGIKTKGSVRINLSWFNFHILFNPSSSCIESSVIAIAEVIRISWYAKRPSRFNEILCPWKYMIQQMQKLERTFHS